MAATSAAVDQSMAAAAVDVPMAAVPGPSKADVQAARLAESLVRKEEKRVRIATMVAEQEVRRQAKLKRKADNITENEARREAKRTKKEAGLERRATEQKQAVAVRAEKAERTATVTLDLGAVLKHVQAAAGEGAKVTLRGLTPQLSVLFSSPEAAQAYVQGQSGEAAVPISVAVRAAPHPGRMLHFPREGMGSRAEAVLALQGVLGVLGLAFAFVDCYGPHLAVQFHSDAEAAGAAARFASDGLNVGGVAVEPAAITIGTPPKGGRREGRGANTADELPEIVQA